MVGFRAALDSVSSRDDEINLPIAEKGDYSPVEDLHRISHVAHHRKTEPVPAVEQSLDPFLVDGVHARIVFFKQVEIDFIDSEDGPQEKDACQEDPVFSFPVHPDLPGRTLNTSR
jgi:hypothetical protein